MLYLNGLKLVLKLVLYRRTEDTLWTFYEQTLIYSPQVNLLLACNQFGFLLVAVIAKYEKPDLKTQKNVII
jgi:hypothetical protein